MLNKLHLKRKQAEDPAIGHPVFVDLSTAQLALAEGSASETTGLYDLKVRESNEFRPISHVSPKFLSKELRSARRFNTRTCARNTPSSLPPSTS